jgi:molybdopterin/thiamine biosynthesis adenylyltransferase
VLCSDCCVVASVVCLRDNVEARQWLNSTLVDLVEFSPLDGRVDVSSVIPLIDGGTEGFGGQARVFLPRLTSCFECSLPSMPPAVGFPSCTIRNVPRLPEHCIVYALKVEWPMLTSFQSPTVFTLYDKQHPSDDHIPAAVALDKDDAAHLTWLYDRASARANAFGIAGVTFALTMQVVKNIIPAIASTNALIAAACVNECWKIRTNAALRLDNYFMSDHAATLTPWRDDCGQDSLLTVGCLCCYLIMRYMGGQPTGTNTETIAYKQNPHCAVCKPPHFLRLNGSRHSVTGIALHSQLITLQQVMDVLTADLQLDCPSLSTSDGRVLFLQSMPASYEANLQQILVGQCDIKSGQQLIVNDKAGNSFKVIVLF